MLVPAFKLPPSAGVGTSTLGECAALSSFSVKLRNLSTNPATQTVSGDTHRCRSGRCSRDAEEQQGEGLLFQLLRGDCTQRTRMSTSLVALVLDVWAPLL